MKSIRLLLALMLAGSSVLFFACSKDEQEPAFITVHKQAVRFYEYFSGDTLYITSNVPWQLSIPLADTSWLKVNITTGQPGTTQVGLGATANAGLPRTSTITIVSLGDPVPPIVIPATQIHWLHIKNFTPAAPGGATIIIDGTGFSPVPSENTVKINGVVAAVQSATNTQLRVVVPPQAGTGKLVVLAGNETDTASTNFIYEWTAMVTTVAGSTYGYQDGPAATAKFYQPAGLKLDASGNLYVADWANHKVRKIGTDGMVTTLPGRYAPGGTGPATDFNYPADIAFGLSGNIYVPEYGAHLVSRVDPSGTVNVLAGNGTASFWNGTGAAAYFNGPAGVVADASGNLFVTDIFNYKIRKITPAGVVTTFVGGPQGDADGIGSAGLFSHPMGIAMDASGNMYVTDFSRIRKISPGGNVTTLAGSGGGGHLDGPASTATFEWLHPIAVDANGVVYVGDGNSTIRFVTTSGMVNTVTHYKNAANGQPMTFDEISGLTVDANGVIYVSDKYHHKIHKFTIQ